ncbi:hypothetical protein DID78_00855 [Candidatus Marinamargulisbacteria bacterium SCGC AG-343-D04]|nr:hypothetical protein DID78_00855 [Candidatus Marinamargulisbacteria bacterium SCGC AG-343-D04]
MDLSYVNRLLEELPGFQTFSEADFQHYLNNDRLFSFAFKKELGKGYLYSIELATQRQLLFNQLPLNQRLDIFKRKCECVGLDHLFDEDLGVGILGLLVDVCDIGMGHSVYKCSFSNGLCVVLKSVDTVFPLYYSYCLHQLKWPYLDVQCREFEGKIWMISDYKESVDLNAYLHSSGLLSEDLVIQLARHACLGDCLGRGDRHFENYIVSESLLYPVDISMLFYPDNEAWVDRYIKGGQSECCILSQYSEFKDCYWNTYVDTFTFLQDFKHVIVESLDHFFSKKECQTFSDFLNTRLGNNKYPAQRRIASEKSFLEFEKRQQYKQQLENFVNKNGVASDLDPLLMMYYRANKDRMTAFFLVDYFERDFLFSKYLNIFSEL